MSAAFLSGWSRHVLIQCDGCEHIRLWHEVVEFTRHILGTTMLREVIMYYSYTNHYSPSSRIALHCP